MSSSSSFNAADVVVKSSVLIVHKMHFVNRLFAHFGSPMPTPLMLSALEYESTSQLARPTQENKFTNTYAILKGI